MSNCDRKRTLGKKQQWKGENCYLTPGVGGLKYSVIYSQEVCTLSLGIIEKQWDGMNSYNLAEQMLELNSGSSTTLSSS